MVHDRDSDSQRLKTVISVYGYFGIYTRMAHPNSRHSNTVPPRLMPEERTRKDCIRNHGPWSWSYASYVSCMVPGLRRRAVADARRRRANG